MNDTAPASATPRASLLARATALLQHPSLVAGPLAAAIVSPAQVAPSLGSDYAAVGSATNSGWFTGVFLDPTGVAASANGTLATLSGVHAVTDSLFWTYDSSLGYTRPGYDTTGVRFVWGGPVNGATISGDTLSVNFDPVPSTVRFNSAAAVPEPAEVTALLALAAAGRAAGRHGRRRGPS